MKEGERKSLLPGERLLRLLASRFEGYSLADDLQEEYRAKIAEKGQFLTLCWYWMQILVAIPHFLLYSLYWSAVMVKNYLRIAMRNSARHKGYSGTNIAGLAVGLAAVILILLYIQFETSFDAFNENADRIYRLEAESKFFTPEKSSLMPGPLAPAMREEFPEVEAVTRLYDMNTVHISCQGKNIFEDRFFFADPEIFDIFSLELVKGDPATALSDPHSIILSEAMAEKYFGVKNPLGETLTFRGNIDFSVTGVLKNMPQNAHFTMNFLVPINTIEQVYDFFSLKNWRASSYNTYFLLKKDADLSTLREKIPAFLEKYLDPEDAGKFTVYFQPLKKIHLYSDTVGEIAKTGDFRIVYLLVAIALLLLVTACINYVNLATARSAQRAREIGVRKVIGARRIQLFRQFLGESMVFTVISVVLALIIAAFFLPTFNSFVERQLTLNLLYNREFIVWLLALVLCVGFLAGTYPAIAISSFRPATILRGRSVGTSSTTLRNILVVAQFTISIILLISTLIINRQMEYIKNKDLGFSKENILIVDMRNPDILNNIEPIKNELKRNPQVLAAAASTFTPNSTDIMTIVDWPGKPEGKEQWISLNFVDYDFIDLYNIEIVKGRNFSRDFSADREGAFLLNETAAATIGWEDPIGQKLTHFMDRRTGTVVGVVKDFHMNPLYQAISPLCLDLNPEEANNCLSVKIAQGDVVGTINYIKNTIAQFSPNYPFEFDFFATIVNRSYQTERKVLDIFAVFSALAIFIACLGLFGLASFTAQQRTKEIGIRKVLGSSTPGIIILLSKNFSTWVLLANIFAWPVTYLAAGQFLKLYAYKTTPGLFIYCLAGFIALFTALLTVSYQAYKAATANPVEALKYE